jgi:hypothetical protein
MPRPGPAGPRDRWLGDHEDEFYCADAALWRLIKEYGLGGAGRANLVVRVPKLAEVELLWRRVLPVAVVAVDLATPVRSTMQQDRFRHHGARVHDPPASASALFSSRHTTQQPKGEAES